MRGSPVETLQRIKWSRDSLAGNHSRSMDIVHISQGLRPAQDTLGAGWPTQQPSHTDCIPAGEETWQKLLFVSSSLPQKPGQMGWRAAGTSWLLFLSFSQVLCLPWEMQIHFVTLSFRQLLQPLFSILPALLQPTAKCCVPEIHPSIWPFLQGVVWG